VSGDVKIIYILLFVRTAVISLSSNLLCHHVDLCRLFVCLLNCCTVLYYYVSSQIRYVLLASVELDTQETDQSALDPTLAKETIITYKHTQE